MPVETVTRKKAEQYEALREKLLQEREELGDEWMLEEFPAPPEEPAGRVEEQRVENPREP